MGGLDSVVCDSGLGVGWVVDKLRRLGGISLKKDWGSRSVIGDAAPTILHVTQSSGGGVPQAVRDYISATPEFHHRVLWPVANSLETDSPDLSAGQLPAARLRQWLAVRAAVRRLRPDLVFAHSSWAGLYTRLPKCRSSVVYQPHGFKAEDEAQPMMLRAAYAQAERMLGSRAWAVVALTPHEAEVAIHLGAARVATVPNVSHARSSVPRPTIPPAQPTVVTCGRICNQKDPNFFLNAVEGLRKRIPDLSAVWVGDGDLRMRERLVASGVQVTGWVSRERTWDLIREASVYMHTAAYEGFPLVVLDAMALETPVVLRRIFAFEGLSSEIIVESPEDMASRVAGLLASSDARGRALAAAESCLSSHSHEAQADALARLFRDAIASGNAYLGSELR